MLAWPLRWQFAGALWVDDDMALILSCRKTESRQLYCGGPSYVVLPFIFIAHRLNLGSGIWQGFVVMDGHFPPPKKHTHTCFHPEIGLCAQTMLISSGSIVNWSDYLENVLLL